ncbi:serine/threonine-protein kinase [Azohydromonas caseinilytica]|uniref:Serine/threonine protein kinase n=1 Tax=Azohydromonas caseinilytica TaxID=2728836 RepID=A0A848FDL0_9BURK|nr:serine/threonine-protein kinase [Azohydromonas caseinilytica]NML16240.1 serine/threonine protein kinase [Azohydromonas caseinilytica]
MAAWEGLATWWRRRREPPPALTATSAQGLVPGSLFAGLRIERLIGRGALGAVYLAREPGSGTARALKTLGLESGGTSFTDAQQAFMGEAQAAQRLHHPDIVQVFAAGEFQGLAYLVMELVPGCDLTRYTQPARLLPEPLVLEIGARMAEALGYAHRQGVLHRDVKPANVMLHLPTGSLKLTDFGLARLHDAARTRSGLLLGTPAFMAPELLAGAPADTRSDLYALAAMLFQLLTARLPHEGDSLGRLLQSIAHEPPLSLRALRPELPAVLDELLARALSKSPAAREADGYVLARELRAIAETAWPGSPGGR